VVAKGTVLINGVCTKKLDMTEMMKQVGVVRQDQKTFNMTIKEYLLLGVDPFHHVDDSAIAEALEIADASKFITKFPGGMNTCMGPLGSELSLSQRVRI